LLSFADTIIRTVELGVTITDAAIDGPAAVVFCKLLTVSECVRPASNQVPTATPSSAQSR